MITLTRSNSGCENPTYGSNWCLKSMPIRYNREKKKNEQINTQRIYEQTMNTIP